MAKIGSSGSSAILIAYSSLLLLASCKEPDRSSNKPGYTTTAEFIAAIKGERDAEKKVILATNLAKELHKNADRATDADIHNLGNLMNDSNDGVRYWTAMAIAQIGPRARSTEPILRSAFEKSVCIRAEVTSAPAIAQALSAMGAAIPYSECQPWLRSAFKLPPRRGAE